LRQDCDNDNRNEDPYPIIGVADTVGLVTRAAVCRSTEPIGIGSSCGRILSIVRWLLRAFCEGDEVRSAGRIRTGREELELFARRFRALVPDSEETKAEGVDPGPAKDLIGVRVELAYQPRAQREAFWPGTDPRRSRLADILHLPRPLPEPD
jgi:hypothetical protein